MIKNPLEMKISPSTHAIPQQPIHANTEKIEYRKKSNSLEISWTQFQERNARISEKNNTEDQEFYMCLLKGKVEIETCLANFDLLRKNVLTTRKIAGKSENGQKLNFRNFILEECQAIIETQLALLRKSFEIRKEKEKLLKLFSSFKIVVVNRRVIVKLTEQKQIDITDQLSTEKFEECRTGNENAELQFILKSLNIPRTIRICCEYRNLKFFLEKEIAGIDEIRKIVEIEKMSIDSGHLKMRLENDKDENKCIPSDAFFNESLCLYIYDTIINDGEPISLVKKVYELLSIYLAVRFFKDKRFIRTKYEIDKKLVFFFLKEKKKIRIEIHNLREMRMFYNERIVEFEESK